MLLRKLLPRTDNFFLLFNQHIELTIQAAQALDRLVNEYAQIDEQQKHQLISQVEDAEKKADKVTEEIELLTHKSLITPFDRDQLHALSNALDDITDLFQDIAKSLELYNVDKVNEDILNFSKVNVKSCILLKEAIALLDVISKKDNAYTILAKCKEVDKLESEADHIKRVAVTNLFRSDTEVIEVIKLNAIYEMLASVSDTCERAAKIIEGIVIDNS